MSSIPISLPEHRVSLPLQRVGDTPVTLDPTDVDLSRYREEAQRIFDQGGKFAFKDLNAIAALFILER